MGTRVGGGGAGLGTGEEVEDDPDYKLGPGTLLAHDFLYWPSSIK